MFIFRSQKDRQGHAPCTALLCAKKIKNKELIDLLQGTAAQQSTPEGEDTEVAWMVEERRRIQE
jgi:hypothetical protein